MLVTIRKKRWWLRWTRFRWTKGGRKRSKLTVGKCEHPDTKKEILIDGRLQGVELLEILLHEMLHATAHDMLAEDWVAEVACDISVALWRLGYRRNGEE